MKKFLCTLVCAMVVMTGVAEAAGKGYTLIVAPSRYRVIQVSQDIVARYPALLVSYQTTPEEPTPLLQVWTASEWHTVSMDDFRHGSFVDKAPARVILIGDDQLLPASLRDAASGLATDVTRVTSLEVSALINEFGRALQWRVSEWKEFSKRYGLNMRDESEPLRKTSWYDQPGPKPRQVEAKPKAAVEETPAPEAPPSEPQPAPAPALPAGADAK